MQASRHHILYFIFILILTWSAQTQARQMTGMYSYMVDATGFIECGQRERLPVAMEADNIALEQAYLKNRYMPGKSLLVSFKGHTALRPKMEGKGQEKVVIVEQFLSIAQQEHCSGIVPPSSLSNTYWKLVELDGQQLVENKNWLQMKQQNSGSIRDIHFIIKNDDFLTGFSGCNQFSGRIISDEFNIKIGPLMSTRKTCPAMKIENYFHQLLKKSDNYHIKGESLELFKNTPENRKSMAKFIAIYF